MPQRASSICTYPGCGTLTRTTRCERHAGVEKREADKRRPNAAQRGYDTRWRKVRRSYLSARPLCVMCQAEGRVVSATVVDHITPHKGDPALMWNEANWQPLCKPCHDSKTAREDGRWG